MNFTRFKTVLISFILIFSYFSPLFAFDDTNILVEEAVNHIYQKRYRQAYQTLKKAYEQSPRHPGVHFNLGRLFELTGNIREALKEYRLAASLDTSMVAARRGLARCIVELKRQQLEKEQQSPVLKHKSAPVVHIEQRPIIPQSNIIRQNPQNYNKIKHNIPLPEVKVTFTEPKLPPLPQRVIAKVSKLTGEKKAEKVLNEGKTDKAILLLNKILKKNPDSPVGHFLMGKALSIKGDLFASIKHFEEALRVDQNYYEAYYLLGKDYAKVNLLDDAIKNYKIYYAVKPQSRVALEMARIYEKMNKPLLAKEYYQKANSDNPGNVAIQRTLSDSTRKVAMNQYYRGSYAFSIKKYKEASSLLNKALSSNTLQTVYRDDAIKKINIAQRELGILNKTQMPIRNGFLKSRKIYGTTDLKYYQLTDINFKTRFTGPITVEWRGYVAKKFPMYGRDFVLMIKELSQDELDIMHRDRNNYRLNENYNNQPVFLVIAKRGTLPAFIKEGKMITVTGSVDWKSYNIVNPLGQTVKMPAFNFISAFPG